MERPSHHRVDDLVSKDDRDVKKVFRVDEKYSTSVQQQAGLDLALNTQPPNDKTEILLNAKSGRPRSVRRPKGFSEVGDMIICHPACVNVTGGHFEHLS